MTILLKYQKWVDFKKAREKDEKSTHKKTFDHADPRFLTMLQREALIDELFTYILEKENVA